VFKRSAILLIGILILAGCGGRKPAPDWTAEEYYQYAKEKYDDEDYFEAVNDFMNLSQGINKSRDTTATTGPGIYDQSPEGVSDIYGRLSPS